MKMSVNEKRELLDLEEIIELGYDIDDITFVVTTIDTNTMASKREVIPKKEV